MKHLYKYNMTILIESKVPQIVGFTIIFYSTEKKTNETN